MDTEDGESSDLGATQEEAPPAAHRAGMTLKSDEIKPNWAHRPRPLDSGGNMWWDLSPRAGAVNAESSFPSGKHGVLR